MTVAIINNNAIANSVSKSLLAAARRAVNQFIDAQYKKGVFIEGVTNLVGSTCEKPIIFQFKGEKQKCWFTVTSFNEEVGRWYFDVFFTKPKLPKATKPRGYKPQRHQAPPAAPQ